jgi:hypothetical protein
LWPVWLFGEIQGGQKSDDLHTSPDPLDFKKGTAYTCTHILRAKHQSAQESIACPQISIKGKFSVCNLGVFIGSRGILISVFRPRASMAVCRVVGCCMHDVLVDQQHQAELDNCGIRGN